MIQFVILYNVYLYTPLHSAPLKLYLFPPSTRRPRYNMNNYLDVESEILIQQNMKIY